jgi:osmotically-inducible protein OsmY
MSSSNAGIVPPRTGVCSSKRVVVEEYPVALPTDELISRHGMSCIRKHVPIVITGLKVIVQGGHVTLQGRVNLAFLSSRAEKIVRELPGVTGLTNQIVVVPPSVASTACNDSAHLHTRSATAFTLLRSTTGIAASGSV